MRVSGLINGGLVNTGHALVNGGVIRAAQSGSPSPPLPANIWYAPGLLIYQGANSGTTPATADNDPVGSWYNSGFDTDVPPVIASGSGLVLNTPSQGGYSSVLYDGSHSLVGGAGPFGYITGGVSLFAVFKLGTIAALQYTVAGATAASQYILAGADTGPNWWYYSNGLLDVSASGPTAGVFYYASGDYPQLTSTIGKMYINGVQTNSQSTGLIPVNVINQICIGSNATPDQFLTAGSEVLEVIGYNPILNTSDRQLVEAYLASKYTIV